MFAHTDGFSSHRLIARESTRRPSRIVSRAVAAAAIIGLFAHHWLISDSAPSTAQLKVRPATIVGTGVIASFHQRPSHNGRYLAEVVDAGSVVEGTGQTWTIHLTGRLQRRIAHATVLVDAWMPETGAHSVIHPGARYIGNGDYRLDSLCLSRPGWWNVALVIDGRAGVDSVAFNVVLPQAAWRSSPHSRCRS